MRIGLDARKINDTGIGRYIACLVDQLLAVDDKNEYVLFFDPKDAGDFEYPKDRVTKIIEPSGKYSIGEHFSLPMKANRLGLDVFHSPHYVLPLFMKVPSVVTVHDVIHLLDPAFGFAAREYARFMIRSASKRARRVITVSDYTKQRLVQILGVPQEKIRVIHNGGGEGFSRAPEGMVEKFLDESWIRRGYYLFVGSDRPHKNLNAVAETLKLMGADDTFVIAGRVRDEAKAMFAQFGERAKFISRNMDKNEMAALYSGASALLFPSFHEGFGLPPLEAMACGTPVVASNTSCMPEILDGSAIMADPRDYRAMAKGLTKLKNDPEFCATYISRGREQLRKFSWKQAARMTLEVYGETA